MKGPCQYEVIFDGKVFRCRFKEGHKKAHSCTIYVGPFYRKIQNGKRGRK